MTNFTAGSSKRFQQRWKVSLAVIDKTVVPMSATSSKFIVASFQVLNWSVSASE